MNTAVCISGQMRTYKHCSESLMRNIIEPLNADIYIHTWRRTGCSHKIDGSRIDEIITEEDLKNQYGKNISVIEEFKDKYINNYKDVTVPKKLREVESEHYKSNIPMLYKIWTCNKLTKQTKKQYDLVIRIRPDMYVNEKLSQNILKDLSKLWFSDYRVNPSFQISDKFALSNLKIMDYYCSVWEKLNQYWQKPFSGNKNEFETNRIGERLMKMHMDKSLFDYSSFHIDCYVLRTNMRRM